MIKQSCQLELELCLTVAAIFKASIWRLGIVTKLLTGSDGIPRAAIVKTVNSEHTRFLHRSTNHLILIELNDKIEEVNLGEQSQRNCPYGNKRSGFQLQFCND